jgi:GNAT superfamily N-acetyltransferase
MPASASEHDVTAVTACLASAFHEDPLWGSWSFPDRSKRAHGLTLLIGAWVRAGVRYPWVRMSAAAEAVALWVPPGVAEMDAEEERAFDALLPELFAARAGELAGVMEQFEINHPRDRPHYYLSLLGTNPAHAGRGLGTALLRECLAEIDSERMPAYLESTNPVNLARYEALGFLPHGQFSYADGPPITTMWREAA